MSTNGRTQDEGAVSRARPSLGELAWIGIVVLIGVVQIIRQQWFDVVVFALAALVLVADAAGRLPSSPSRVRRISGRVLWIAAIALAAVVALLPRHGPAMMVALGLIGIAALVVVWPGTAPREPWPHGLKLLGWWWAAILVAGCLWELAQFIRGRVAPDVPAPALSDLLNPILTNPVGHAVFTIVWVAVGAFFIRKAVHR